MIKQSSGFSLIEVMAAIVVLTVAFFPIVGYFTNSIGFVTQRGVLTEANDITVNTMEYLKKESENNWNDLLVTSLENYNFGEYQYFNKSNLIDNSNIEYFSYELNGSNYELTASDQSNAAFAKVTLRLIWDDNKEYLLTSILKARKW